MKQRPRIYYTAAQKDLMWERWKKGDNLHQIAQLFDRHHPSIQRILAESGGIKPPPRCRSELALTLAEREAISRGLASGQSMRSIASELGRSPSTISREISRNGGQKSYRANQSDQAAWDRGKEMAEHKRFTLATDVKVYFCDPQHPWQRGSNENTNGLLRQYFPKGMSLANYSQAKLNAVARQLNERPRKTLNYQTPAERFALTVASTG
jgi:IS30 family transposase